MDEVIAVETTISPIMIIYGLPVSHPFFRCDRDLKISGGERVRWAFSFHISHLSSRFFFERDNGLRPGSYKPLRARLSILAQG